MRRSLLLAVFLLASLPSVLAAAEGQTWSYEGEEGPEHWGELTPEYDICARGWNQSPIDLVADADANLPALVFEYTKPGALNEVNNGHSIQEFVKPGNYLWARGEQFELKHFHFHSPSEHTVAGNEYAMEIHLVHQNNEGELVVVGLLFDEGPDNPQMDQLPSFRIARGEDPYNDPFDYNEFITNRQDYFVYNGSLTTPPCSEGVQWFILKTPIQASPRQIQHYHDLLGFDNNRPIQPHNSRLVLE